MINNQIFTIRVNSMSTISSINVGSAFISNHRSVAVLSPKADYVEIGDAVPLESEEEKEVKKEIESNGEHNSSKKVKDT